MCRLSKFDTRKPNRRQNENKTKVENESKSFALTRGRSPFPLRLSPFPLTGGASERAAGPNRTGKRLERSRGAFVHYKSLSKLETPAERSANAEAETQQGYAEVRVGSGVYIEFGWSGEA